MDISFLNRSSFPLFLDFLLILMSQDIGNVMNIETYASSAALERENLSYQQWAKRLDVFYQHVEKIFSPDLFIIGGGVSKDHAEFLPLLNLETPVVAAITKNSAGIIGAALGAIKR